MEIKHEKMYMSDGTLYVPIKIEKPSDAMIVLHHTILRHTADMFRAMTTAIAERYKLDEEEILETIAEHPNFKNFVAHPILTDLGDYFEDSPPANTKKVVFKKKSTKEETAALDPTASLTPAALPPAALPPATPLVASDPTTLPKKKLDLSKVRIKAKA